jgi:hypothetical protein
MPKRRKHLDEFKKHSELILVMVRGENLEFALKRYNHQN